jgi:ADP-ribose pyrophosphatase
VEISTNITDITNDDINNLSETILNKSLAYDGGFLTIDKVDVKVASGEHSVHQVLRHPGAVAILAVNKREEVLLVKQYRTAVEQITLEIPAGKIDEGENPQTAGIRELSEETGYTAAIFEPLIDFWPAVGYSDETLYLYVARDLTAGETHMDTNEFINSVWVPKTELINLIKSGKIMDSKTIIAVMLFE